MTISDNTTTLLAKVIEKPQRAHLWSPADAITFTPRVLPKLYGDGRALFSIATINQRPAYWVIRACSSWGSAFDSFDTSGPDFGEMTDEILADLEEAFGNGLCGYSANSLFHSKRERAKYCKCEECRDRFVARWPMVNGDGGCSWSRMRWPTGFSTEQDGYFLNAAQDARQSRALAERRG